MMRTIFDHKIFQPIAIYTVMVVCVNALTGVAIFTHITLIGAFLSSVIMALNIYRNQKYWRKNAIIEFGYAVIIYVTIVYMPLYIRTFYSVVLVIIEFTVYILYINPKFMGRNLVYKID